MTEEEAYRRFLEYVGRPNMGQRGFALALGLSPSYINDVVHKRRALSDRILRHIGIERVVVVEYRERTS